MYQQVHWLTSLHHRVVELAEMHVIAIAQRPGNEGRPRKETIRSSCHGDEVCLRWSFIHTRPFQLPPPWHRVADTAGTGGGESKLSDSFTSVCVSSTLHENQVKAICLSFKGCARARYEYSSTASNKPLLRPNVAAKYCGASMIAAGSNEPTSSCNVLRAE